MRALVLGGTGMLGKAVVTHWRRRQQPVLGLSHAQADITDRPRLAEWMRSFHPEIVVNCAAFTAVDGCETEREKALAINGTAVAHVVDTAREIDARVIHLSSDYVFDGRARTPYVEGAPTGPRSVYGESKLRGEKEALRYERSLVLRASWLFGPGGQNFVTTIRRLLDEGKGPLKVVDDQVGCPTYTPFLARAIWDLARRQRHGVVHYGNRAAVTWHGFATEIARLVAPDAEIFPVSTAEYPRPAQRPAYSVLDTHLFETAVGRPVETWSSGLAAYLQQENVQ